MRQADPKLAANQTAGPDMATNSTSQKIASRAGGRLNGKIVAGSSEMNAEIVRNVVMVIST